jgi:hypothetical protein
MTVDLGTIVGLLLSAGGGAFVVALVKGFGDMKAGARAGQREVVKDLMEWRDDLERKLRDSAADSDFWRDLAAQRGAQLREAGIPPASTEPVPPSQRALLQGPPPARRRPARRRGELEGGDEA